MAPGDLQSSVMKLFDYQQDFSQNIQQAALTTYYEALATRSKIVMLKNQVNRCTVITRQKMRKCLSEGRFVRNVAIETATLQLYNNNYNIFPGKTTDPHITTSYDWTPSIISTEQMKLLSKKLANAACKAS
jgi:hypothetical protein